MARIRTIKPELPQSESLNNVSRDARLTFVYLLTLADDAGRIKGTAKILAGQLFPCDQDRDSIVDWFEELERERCIIRYQVDGSSYLALTKWKDHQKIDKPTPSRLPPPPEGAVSNGREQSRSVDGTSVPYLVPSTKDLGPGTLDQGPSTDSTRARAKPPAFSERELDRKLREAIPEGGRYWPIVAGKGPMLIPVPTKPLEDLIAKMGWDLDRQVLPAITKLAQGKIDMGDDQPVVTWEYFARGALQREIGAAHMREHRSEPKARRDEPEQTTIFERDFQLHYTIGSITRMVKQLRPLEPAHIWNALVMLKSGDPWPSHWGPHPQLTNECDWAPDMQARLGLRSPTYPTGKEVKERGDKLWLDAMAPYEADPDSWDRTVMGERPGHPGCKCRYLFTERQRLSENRGLDISKLKFDEKGNLIREPVVRQTYPGQAPGA